MNDFVILKEANDPVGSETTYENKDGKWYKTTKSYYHGGGETKLTPLGKGIGAGIGLGLGALAYNKRHAIANKFKSFKDRLFKK